MIEEGHTYALRGIDEGFVKVVVDLFDKLQRDPYPSTKIPAFLTDVQKAADAWKLCKDAIEAEAS